MKAIQIQSHGGLEVLRVTTLPGPQLVADEVLVRIKASAVNPLDGIIRMGDFPIARKPPLILGEEAAGIVERNGAGFKAGERVIIYGGGLGIFRDGTWAEAVAVPASSLRRLPDAISFAEGAALTNVGVTAYGALRVAGLKLGEALVVLGATGWGWLGWRPDWEGNRGSRHRSCVHCGEGSEAPGPWSRSCNSSV